VIRVTILGCGASGGVPLLGCTCPVCTSTDPRDRRRRSSVLIDVGTTKLLVDASPDLRQQLMDADAARLDAVLFTHAHADHCHGIDDLRLVCRAMDGALPAYGTSDTLDELKRRFGYAFDPRGPASGWFKPALLARAFDGPFEIGDVVIRPFRQAHGPRATTLGFRVGDFAYSTDVSDLDDLAFEALAGLDTWVVDCQSIVPSYVHSHLERTLEWIERARPRRAVLTHMGHEMGFATIAAGLPRGVEPGYDGQVLAIGGPS
jgi:phosphoribosyl 1,2-cyclic phosphate phosphodiesterase